MSKDQRWYEIREDQTVFVYDAPRPEMSFGVSIVTKADLPYYRANFDLTRIWGRKFVA